MAPAGPELVAPLPVPAPELVNEGWWWVAEEGEPPVVPGFVHSSFSPLVAAVADRVLTDHYLDPSGAATSRERTGLILASRAGDQVSAEHVRQLVAAGKRPGPLFFFQSVPNSIAGQVAAHWGLGGPVVCLSPVSNPVAEGTEEAALLMADGDADEMLLVIVEQSLADGRSDCAHALLLRKVPVSEDRSEERARTGAIVSPVSEDRGEERARTGAIDRPVSEGETA